MIPKDPMMLVSYVNMKLRDRYRSLEDLCDDLDVDVYSLTRQLEEAGFHYREESNQFV